MPDVYNKRKLTVKKLGVAAAKAANYPLAAWLHDPDLSAVQGVPEKHWKLDGDTIVPMTAQEATDFDTEELRVAKIRKNMLIDEKTVELIMDGFDYDGHHFSLSDHAQINWVMLGVMDAQQLITYPKKISTTDISIEYSLQNKAALNAFVEASANAAEGPRDSGRTLKLEVEACTTVEDVENIVDPR